MEITLIRHAQTTANAEGILQGQSQGSLTELGQQQTEALAERIDINDYDLLLASDLDRALETAQALGGAFVPDHTWRELDIGDWEGMTRDEVKEHYAEDLLRMRAGEEVHFGDGESFGEFSERVRSSFDVLAERLTEGQAALVVTHGGVINEVIRHVVGLPDRSGRFGRSANTAVTHLTGEDGSWSLEGFNDATHLEAETPYLRERIASGRQAAFLAPSSSPLRRALELAAALDGFDPVLLEELATPGKWDGETWEKVGTKMTAGVHSALTSTNQVRIGIVSHGAAIRAYLARVLELSHTERHRLAAVENGSVSTVVFEERGPVIADFNVSYH